jgi:hypothetical protein
MVRMVIGIMVRIMVVRIMVVRIMVVGIMVVRIMVRIMVVGIMVVGIMVIGLMFRIMVVQTQRIEHGKSLGLMAESMVQGLVAASNSPACCAPPILNVFIPACVGACHCRGAEGDCQHGGGARYAVD